jgi:hypothetical protein
MAPEKIPTEGRAVGREAETRQPGWRGVRQMPTAYLTTIFLFTFCVSWVLVKKNALNALEVEQHSL